VVDLRFAVREIEIGSSKCKVTALLPWDGVLGADQPNRSIGHKTPSRMLTESPKKKTA
jgi:hypothetical protein